MSSTKEIAFFKPCISVSISIGEDGKVLFMKRGMNLTGKFEQMQIPYNTTLFKADDGRWFDLKGKEVSVKGISKNNT